MGSSQLAPSSPLLSGRRPSNHCPWDFEMRHGHAPNLGTRWPGHGRVCAAWRHERLALFGSVHAGRHLLATGRRGLRGGRRGLSIFPHVAVPVAGNDGGRGGAGIRWLGRADSGQARAWVMRVFTAHPRTRPLTTAKHGYYQYVFDRFLELHRQWKMDKRARRAVALPTHSAGGIVADHDVSARRAQLDRPGIRRPLPNHREGVQRQHREHPHPSQCATTLTTPPHPGRGRASSLCHAAAECARGCS